MEFKDYPQGKLEFQTVKAEFIKETKFQPKFKLGNDYYHSESFAKHFYISKGYDAFFAENEVWVKLLFYLFNDELKISSKHRPEISDLYYYLYDDDFFNENEDKFIKRFNYLKHADLETEIKNNFQNPDFKTIAICSHLENNQILYVLFDLIQNLNIRKRGFPDLFVYNSEDAFFCEVKGNSDMLNYVQIKKHEVLLKAGINVVVFGINKPKYWIKEQEKKYFNMALFRRKNLIDNYDSKIYVSDTVYSQLEDYGIVEFKDNFINEYGENAFIGFLNIIEGYSLEEKMDAINSPSEKIILKSIKKGNELRELNILKNAKILEDKRKYHEAIGEYSKVDSFDAYKRRIYCYRKLYDYENELNLIYNGINDSNFNKKEIGFLKRRLKRFFKNEKDYDVIETSLKCPYCGERVVLNKFHTRNKIKFLTCSNEKCYWYSQNEK